MCSKPQLEFLTHLLLFNFAKHLTNNNIASSNNQNIFKFSVENAPLEPPTPPRTPIITASQTDATSSQRIGTTLIEASTIRFTDQSDSHKSPQLSINNDGEYGPSSPWSNVSQAAASTSSISVAPVAKLIGNDNADRRSRTSSTNDGTLMMRGVGGEDNSDVDQGEDDDDEEDNLSATHAFDLSYPYNDDSNGSGSGEDQGSEGGTTINSFELSMARKDRSNDVSFDQIFVVLILKLSELFAW